MSRLSLNMKEYLMSYDITSPILTINFTDGSYLTVINESMYRRKYSRPGQYEEIVPCMFISNLDNNNYEVLKFDLDGNTWKISNNYITIGNTTFNRGNDKLMYLSYDPDTNKFRANGVYGITIPSMTDHYTTPNITYAVDGTVYKRDTSGTDFSSIGAAIYAAETAYNNSPIGGHPAWYRINNITGKSNNVPMYGLNVWYGETLNLGDQDFIGAFLRGNVTHSDYATLDLDDSLGDYDPDVTEEPSTDPFEPGGDTGNDDPGGNGDFTDENDDIPIPPVPTLTAVDTGFITLFNPSLAQLQSLASYMWGSLFDITNWKKLYADPMDCILGLSIVPVAVPNGASKEVKVGNLGTGISLTTAGSQYVEVDCGSLNVNEYWGAYLDYSPYTKAEIYLPYIGTHPLDIDDIMKKTIAVKYHVDILSGACTAYVKCGGSVLYEFIGQCASSIPISGNDFTNVVNGVLTIAGAIGTMVASGGAAAPMVAGAGTIASAAVNNLKPSVEKSGSMSGTGGMMAVQTPYLILTRPRQALPRSQNSYMGYPTFKTVGLNEVSGYTEVDTIRLTGVPGTDAELDEIVELLKKGVIL